MAKKRVWTVEQRLAHSEMMKQRHASGVYDSKKKKAGSNSRKQKKLKYQRTWRANKKAEAARTQEKRDTTTRRLKQATESTTPIDTVFAAIPQDVTVTLHLEVEWLLRLLAVARAKDLTPNAIVEQVVIDYLKAEGR